MKPLSLLFVAFVFFGACNNAAHEQTYAEKQDSITMAFKEADNSIEPSASPADKSKALYAMIKTSESISAAQKIWADSLSVAYNATTDFIRDTKKKLELTEDNNAEISVVNKIMIDEKNVVKLYYLLDKFSKLAIASCGSTPNAKTEEDIFTFLRSNKSAAEFNNAYFENMPGPAAITMLNKFNNDCAKAQQVALEELSKTR
jgi:hypothetical protein